MYSIFSPPTKGEDLPEQDAIGPHVTQGGVQVMEDTLWGHPLQGQECLRGPELERTLASARYLKVGYSRSYGLQFKSEESCNLWCLNGVLMLTFKLCLI